MFNYLDYSSPRSPLYTPPRSPFHCSVCGEGIYEGDEYIENDGDYVHFECIPNIRWLLGWLGYDIKEMEDFVYYKE